MFSCSSKKTCFKLTLCVNIFLTVRAFQRGIPPDLLATVKHTHSLLLLHVVLWLEACFQLKVRYVSGLSLRRIYV